MSLYINTDEHVFIAGMTGSGKSYLAENYLASYKNVVKLDTKDEVTERRKQGKPLWGSLVENKDFTVVTTLTEIETVTTDKIIYVPNFEEQNLDFYNALMKWVYYRENTILWIDELMSVAESATKYPNYLKALMTRGRSKNVAVWSLTQRPVDIPTICTANSTHFFVFDLMLEQDRYKMMQVTGMPEMKDRPGKYLFWYFKNGNDKCIKATIKR
ncbi:TPA: hypothetical protein KRM58_003523 [Clostridioides difficile]|nr:hypothetical protein [Clostridioides difficile]HBH1802303.1 hypothetical protein [Clostridioides difficile]